MLCTYVEESVILADMAEAVKGFGTFVWIVGEEHKVVHGRDFILSHLRERERLRLKEILCKRSCCSYFLHA